MDKNPLGIVAISISDFQFLKESGDFQTFPKEVDLTKTFNELNVLEMFFPEGSLDYPEDKIVHFLEYKDETLYGQVYFCEKNSSKKSLIIFAQKPYFTTFEPLLKICMRKVFDRKGEELACLEELFKVIESMNPKEDNIIFDDEVVPIELKNFEKDEYPGIDLVCK